MEKKSIHQWAQDILNAEAAAIKGIVINEAFEQAVELAYQHTSENKAGSLVISGLGKCNFIAQKISATLASTGTPSHFLHPTEAMHGDLGRIRSCDVVVLLSFSGNTEEVISLAALLRQDHVPTIAITGNADSHLAKLATVTLWIGNITEACPHNLAPTASTTAMLALGDALALCVSRKRDFKAEDFRKFHPGGLLGRQLMPVTEAMRFAVGHSLELAHTGMTLGEAYQLADEKSQGRRAGAMLIVNEQGKLAGIFTDSDLRRLVVKEGGQVMNLPIEQVMTANPKHLTSQSLVRDAVQMARELRIDEIPVVDENNQPLGLIDVQDLVALKVIES